MPGLDMEAAVTVFRRQAGDMEFSLFILLLLQARNPQLHDMIKQEKKLKILLKC